MSTAHYTIAQCTTLHYSTLHHTTVPCKNLVLSDVAVSIDSEAVESELEVAESDGDVWGTQDWIQKVMPTGWYVQCRAVLCIVV